jgi:Homeodomain-like domain
MLPCTAKEAWMAGKDIIVASQRELKRLHIIQKVLEGALKQTEAAELLLLSTRQTRRISSRIKEEGAHGVVHRSRGRASNRKLPGEVKERVLELYRKHYEGFGPTLAQEKLHEREGICISDETLRTWLLGDGLWKKKRKWRQHRQWRPRKNRKGEMIQIDGSHHDWFEGRGPSCVFMGYIDDATGKVFGRFYEYEGTIPAMDSFRRYIRKNGLPMSLYMDKHTTYKSTGKLTLEDELTGTEPMSEFGRAMKELGVELIHANSPQAKGRVERLFNTLQDRLVKEMRLKGISSIVEANEFLREYLPIYNRRFAKKAAQRDNLHRPIPKGLNLDRILCIKTERTLRNDFTIAHDRTLYQIEESITTKKLMVEEYTDGSMAIWCRGQKMKFRQVSMRPERPQKQSAIRASKTVVIPPKDHPWRKFLYGTNTRKKVAA